MERAVAGGEGRADFEQVGGGDRLYFCVIDRLSYEDPDLALAHVRIQHGLTNHGEPLLRVKYTGAEG